MSVARTALGGSMVVAGYTLAEHGIEVEVGAIEVAGQHLQQVVMDGFSVKLEQIARLVYDSQHPGLPVGLETKHEGYAMLSALTEQSEAGVAEIEEQTEPSPAFIDL